VRTERREAAEDFCFFFDLVRVIEISEEMLMTKVIQLVLIGLLVVSAAYGCDKKETGGAATAGAAEGVPGALASYEAIRDLLAKDQTAGLADKAGELQTRATAAAAGASEKDKPKLGALASAAGELKAKAGDIEAARKQFGEVSRHVVELLADNPGLREGRHVFECPMAQGYTKWVQTKAEIENPYMGKKMLECGGTTDWKS
jgi:membrane fusion protein, copper/silver efflux system